MNKKGNVLQRNIDGRSRDHCCRGKAMSVTYSELVFVALVIHHAKRMRHVVLASVAIPAVQHFPTLSKKKKKGHDFREKKKVTENKMCVLIFYNFFPKHF